MLLLALMLPQHHGHGLSEEKAQQATDRMLGL